MMKKFFKLFINLIVAFLPAKSPSRQTITSKPFLVSSINLSWLIAVPSGAMQFSKPFWYNFITSKYPSTKIIFLFECLLRALSLKRICFFLKTLVSELFIYFGKLSSITLAPKPKILFCKFMYIYTFIVFIRIHWHKMPISRSALQADSFTSVLFIKRWE